MAEPFYAGPFRRIVAIRCCAARLNGLAEVRAGGSVRWYPKGGGAWQSPALLQGNAADFAADHPGRFTGEMRQVVQDHLSRGLSVPYSYTWATSHGIFTATNGGKWVVEISAAGVTAWPLSMLGCAESEQVEALGYVPKPSPRPAEGVLSLAPAATLANFYARQGLFAACGWAFSPDGHAAVNTAQDWRGNYKHSYLYQLTISESNGAPDGAILVQLADGTLYGDRISHFKTPNYALGTLESFDLYYNEPIQPPASAPAPIMAWYDPGGDLQRVDWHWDPGTPITDGERTGTEGQLRSCSSPALPAAEPRDQWTGSQTTVTSYVRPGLWRIGTGNDYYRIREDVTEQKQGWTYDSRPTDVVVIPFNDRQACYHARRVALTDTYTYDAEGDWFGIWRMAAENNVLCPSINPLGAFGIEWFQCTGGNYDTHFTTEFSNYADGILTYEERDEPLWGSVTGGFNCNTVEPDPLAAMQHDYPDATGVCLHSSACTNHRYIEYYGIKDGICDYTNGRAWSYPDAWALSLGTLYQIQEHGTPVDNSEDSWDVKLWLDGAAIPIASATSQSIEDWLKYLEPEAFQIALVAADANRGGSLIYAQTPSPSTNVYAGTGAYPIADLAYLPFCFIGEP